LAYAYLFNHIIFHMKKPILLLAALCAVHIASCQISAKLMRYMDVSDDQITFVYGGDIWVMPKEGGRAIQVTHSPGEESWPRFSPDGSLIAFTASYNGNPDVYVMPAAGGVPTRVTYHSLEDRLVEWHPDGERLLIASKRESGRQSFSQFYLVGREGGMASKLNIPYGELASFSPDGNSLAYITRITENYPFKRYRGGLSSDILVYDLVSDHAVNITDNRAIDGKPAWVGDQIFFLSDRGEHMRLNVWVYDTKQKRSAQVTFLKEFDISYLSAGKDELVFEAGGVLYLMDAETGSYAPVTVSVVSDLSLEMPRSVNVSRDIQHMSASPWGKRIVFEARGELFNVPVREGYVLNMTRSSGAFDMMPAWSPDGKSIAYWSDRSGEYELYLQDPDMEKDPEQLTRRGKGFGYQLHWSPDSRKIAFIDETNNISVVDVISREIVVAGNYGWNYGHGSRYSYHIAWSPDSKWMAFTKGLDNSHNAVFLYNVKERTSHQVTSGFFDDSGPVFSIDGKYLFFLTDRSMNATYSDLGDGTWVYPNATQLASIPLAGDTPSLLCPRNDEVKKDEDQKKAESGKEPGKGSGETEKDTAGKVEVRIDLEGMESRMAIMPADAGNIGWLASFKDKLVYLRNPNTGSESRSSSLVCYDLKKREEKTIISDVDHVELTADGGMMLVSVKGKYGIIKPAEKQTIEEPVPADGLVMELVPREEWRQIFLDTWRRYRDFFYDPEMHGVDWEGLKEQYGALIEDARSRWDVSYITSNLAAELSAGHTYTFGGDVEEVKSIETGFLGVDWEPASEGYRIRRIVRPAAWDTEIRSPFDRPGLKVKEGDYIHAVNGIPVDPAKDPFAAFEGLSGKTVVLLTSGSGKKEETEQVVVKCLTPREEISLRYLEWVENNRKMVERLSDGRLGYVYMSNTAGRGQQELVQMFYGQLARQGFIIDERFNGGGQLADRFLELLQRPVVYNLHWRHGRDHTQPSMTNTGPMGMLINGWAGSGGDGLPWAFQELKAGPIVGERTLGILVGPATGHRLIDGGGITVPGARLYDNDGHWFREGEGVTPDIEVWDDPNILIQGRDPQIERVVEEVLKLLELNPPEMTPAPQREDRTAGSLSGS
jgi:tricorn protease